MPVQPPVQPFDPAVLAQLACPACHSDLSQEAARLVCQGCGRAYPILDGIPALVVDRAGAPGTPAACPSKSAGQ